MKRHPFDSLPVMMGVVGCGSEEPGKEKQTANMTDRAGAVVVHD